MDPGFLGQINFRSFVIDSVRLAAPGAVPRPVWGIPFPAPPSAAGSGVPPSPTGDVMDPPPLGAVAATPYAIADRAAGAPHAMSAP